MPSKKPQFVIRADQEVLKKIAYIAQENERSSTQEIVYLIKQRIKSYEAEHGEIQLDEPKRKEAWNAQMKNIQDKKTGKKGIVDTLKDSWENGKDFGNAKK